jgi:hypothetical protein
MTIFALTTLSFLWSIWSKLTDILTISINLNEFNNKKSVIVDMVMIEFENLDWPFWPWRFCNFGDGQWPLVMVEFWILIDHFDHITSIWSNGKKSWLLNPLSLILLQVWSHYPREKAGYKLDRFLINLLSVPLKLSIVELKNKVWVEKNLLYSLPIIYRLNANSSVTL